MRSPARRCQTVGAHRRRGPSRRPSIMRARWRSKEVDARWGRTMIHPPPPAPSAERPARVAAQAKSFQPPTSKLARRCTDRPSVARASANAATPQ
eukprot:7442472-Pyramimonas_sp.AAC.1